MKEYICSRCGKKILYRVQAPIRISKGAGDAFGSYDLRLTDTKGKSIDLCPDCRNDLTNIVNNWMQGFL